MEKDVDEVGKIGRFIKSKIEDIDREVWLIFLPLITFSMEMHIKEF